MQTEKGKVTVQLEITAVIDNSDTGYLGLGESVQKHISKATSDAQSWQFLIKRGATEPEPVKVRVKVLSVSIIPERP
jgi:ribosomal protein S5